MQIDSNTMSGRLVKTRVRHFGFDRIVITPGEVCIIVASAGVFKDIKMFDASVMTDGGLIVHGLILSLDELLT